ncbi:MAG: hypothetical protein R3B06_25135 [Kofleriaceae bacterium]
MRRPRLLLPLIAATALLALLVGQRGWAQAACIDAGMVRTADGCRCCRTAAAHQPPAEAQLTGRCCSLDESAPLVSAPAATQGTAPAVVTVDPVAIRVAVARPRALVAAAPPRPVETGPPIWLATLVLRL